MLASLFSRKNLAKTVNFKRGLIMWTTLLLGYFLFVTAWFSAGNTAGNGTNGWSLYFFGGPVPSAISQATNYGITFARGIGSFLIGWAIVKFTHKWASMIALLLNSMAILSVVIGYLAGGQAGYWLFIFFRLFLAVGGTTLIVLLQPVVAKSVSNPKVRSLLQSISPFGFNLGFIIMSSIFVAPSVAKVLREGDNWFYFSLVFALLTLIPLVIYIISGVNFDTKPAQQTNADGTTQKPATMMSVLKERNTWAWIAVYSFWLVTAVMPLLGTNHTANFGLIKKDAIVQGIASDNVVAGLVGTLFETSRGSLRLLWAILFVAGSFVGNFTIGRFSKTDHRRKPFYVGITVIALGFWIFSIISIGTIGYIPYLISAFLFGVCVWGIQGPMLNNPYDFKNVSPQKVGIFFGMIWGVGYMVFTLVNIILAFVVDVSPVAYYIILTLCIAMVPVFLAMTKEPFKHNRVSFNPFSARKTA